MEIAIPAAGGCQCGAIRYRINAQPLTLYCCHCRDCQRQSSSAFGLSLWVNSHEFELTRGELSTWSTRGDSGLEKHCTFCSRCGSRVYHVSADTPDVLSVKGGTLDVIDSLQPVGHIWTCRAHNWLDLQRQGKPCFEVEPEDFGVLIDAWRAQ